jgi:hypothetical protein
METIFKVQRALLDKTAPDLLTDVGGCVCQQVPREWFNDLFNNGQPKVYFRGEVDLAGKIRVLASPLPSQTW